MAKVFEKKAILDHDIAFMMKTFMLAINELSIKEIFAALYANTDLDEEPMSDGRQMGSHLLQNTHVE